MSAAFDRRAFLRTSILGTAGPAMTGCATGRRWQRSAYRKPERSRVAILRADGYDAPLPQLVTAGLRLFSLDVRGKTVALKPNLVEFDPGGAINTHPMLIAAAIEAFRELGARQVLVAEGPGHRRDNEYLLRRSGLQRVLAEHATPYVDLNTDDVRPLTLRSDFSGLSRLYLPETILDADLVVSMPKLKTHHWAGVTLSMKNLFGIVPGAVYGWPKNVLHWAGIHESIVDIASTVPVPLFAIVDGIVGMEGNGPIQGTPKASGVLVLGDDLVAVDASAARVMNIEPTEVKHVRDADQFLGNARLERVVQIGETLERVQQDFRVVESWRHAKATAAMAGS